MTLENLFTAFYVLNQKFLMVLSCNYLQHMVFFAKFSDTCVSCPTFCVRMPYLSTCLSLMNIYKNVLNEKKSINPY